MSKTKYIPDRTWKNIRLASNFKRNIKPVLSCKACPEGVSPEKNYGFFEEFLLVLIGCLLHRVLHGSIQSFANVMLPQEWNHTIVAFLSFCLEVSCCYIIPIPFFVLMSFYFMKWGPAEKSEIESAQKKAL